MITFISCLAFLLGGILSCSSGCRRCNSSLVPVYLSEKESVWKRRKAELSKPQAADMTSFYINNML